jgi:uncharacterized protein (DUF58 family)
VQAGKRPKGGFFFLAWDYPFTRPGKLLIAGIAITALTGAVSKEAPIYQLCVALIVLELMASAVGSLLRWWNVFGWTRLSLRGRLPERVSAGQPLAATFTVTNAGRLPTYDLSLGCFRAPRSWKIGRTQEMTPHLGSQQSIELTLRMTPLQRGLYNLPPIRLFTTFPFNLFRNELGRCPTDPVLVLPRFHPLTRIRLDVGNRYQPGGLALTSHIGESPEYIGNRDYLPGDAARRIDFRSWARLAKPVVKEYQEEYYCRIALVLDTSIAPRRKPRRAGFPDLEAAVSLSAAVADALSQGEYIIDIFAAGPELHVFRSGRHTAHFDNVLEILACVGPCRDNPFDKVTPRLIGELASISSVVCVFLDWDASRQQLVRAALEAGCHVKVLIVRDGPTTDSIDQLGGMDLAQYTPAQIDANLIDII